MPQRQVFRLIFLVVFIFSCAEAREQQYEVQELDAPIRRENFQPINLQRENSFLPATQLSSKMIGQVVEVAKDVHELKPESKRRIINGIDYTILSHFEVETEEIQSCLALYTLNPPQPSSYVFVAHRRSKKTRSNLAEGHERLYPHLQRFMDVLNTSNAEIFFIGDNEGAALAYLSATKTVRDRPDLLFNQVKTICFDMKALEEPQVGSLRRHIPFYNVLNFNLTFSSYNEALALSIKTLFLERVNLAGICLSSQEFLLRESEDLIIGAYMNFQNQAAIKSLTKAGLVPFFSSDRNPVIHWLKRFLLG